MKRPTLEVPLAYRPPYDWPTMIAHLAARAIEGVEVVDGETYARTIAIGGAAGTVRVAHDAARARLNVSIYLADAGARVVSEVAERLRHLFDLDADIAAIGAHLARDRRLAPLVARRPGLRVPGAWDPFELAMRAVLGQQVTVEAARKLLGRLVIACARVGSDAAGERRLACLFPAPEDLLAADLSALGMPGARRETLVRIARAAVDDPSLFEPRASLDEALARLKAVRGVGPWTAHYVALRGMRHPDAFPASDVGLLRAAARDGRRPTPKELTAWAQAWRPWRAYAAQHLWASHADLPTPARAISSRARAIS